MMYEGQDESNNRRVHKKAVALLFNWNAFTLSNVSLLHIFVFLCLGLVFFMLTGGLYTLTIYVAFGREYSTIEVDGVNRAYIERIPSCYNHVGNGVPVLFALHGGGGNALNMGRNGFTPVAERECAIVVYPEGTSSNLVSFFFPYWLKTWNAGYCCGHAYDANVDDVGFLKALIAHMLSVYNIDTSRVYFTGHSNGGMMTYRMASELPESIVAVAPVSGSVGGWYDCNVSSTYYHIPTFSQSVSLNAIHGLLDDHVPYDGGHGASTVTAGYRCDLSVNSSVTFFLDQDGCTSSNHDVINTPGGKFRIDEYSQCVNATITKVTMNEAGHNWSDMNDQWISDGPFNQTDMASGIYFLLSRTVRD